MTGRPRLLALWSVPRSRSTAFFRMMLQRGDRHAVHEPFSYLAEFGTVTVDGAEVRTEPDLLAALRRLSAREPVFFKDTTDARYPHVLHDDAFLATDAVHAFLIRHPARTIASYHAINPAMTRDQIGFEHLHEIYTAVAAATGTTPCVIEADELVADPAAGVAAFCRAVGIDFRPDALAWEPGDRAEWAPSARWHRAVSGSHRLTATVTAPAVDPATHPVLRRYLDHQLPFYEALHATAVPLHTRVPHPDAT
jgi:hypothetical protein